MIRKPKSGQYLLFPEDQPEDPQTPQPRDLPDTRQGRKARACRPIFQAPQLAHLTVQTFAKWRQGMQSKLLHEANGKRTFAVILQKGDEAMRCLQDFAVNERLGGAQITAIGAFSSAKFFKDRLYWLISIIVVIVVVLVLVYGR